VLDDIHPSLNQHFVISVLEEDLVRSLHLRSASPVRLGDIHRFKEYLNVPNVLMVHLLIMLDFLPVLHASKVDFPIHLHQNKQIANLAHGHTMPMRVDWRFAIAVTCLQILGQKVQQVNLHVCVKLVIMEMFHWNRVDHMLKFLRWFVPLEALFHGWAPVSIAQEQVEKRQTLHMPAPLWWHVQEQNMINPRLADKATQDLFVEIALIYFTSLPEFVKSVPEILTSGWASLVQ
jgi:hypothetical protein